ncbi:dihydropteroate synthase [Brucellaceae bacterium C25G]
MLKQWQLAHGKSLELGAQAVIMGILNVTPNSFSDGGHHFVMEDALKKARQMIDDGARIIDVGGESTKPNAEPVDALTEQKRILPVIKTLSDMGKCIISVDTYRAETAKLAIEAGAHIVNDVWGLHREPDIALVAKETGAGLVLMHTSRERDCELDPIDDQVVFFKKSIKIAHQAGINDNQIVLDPGFGFTRSLDEDVELLSRFKEMAHFPYSMLVGTSRKRFIGQISGISDPLKRDIVTSATSVALRLDGADIFRVHDVNVNAQALAVADSILQSRTNKR